MAPSPTVSSCSACCTRPVRPLPSREALQVGPLNLLASALAAAAINADLLGLCRLGKWSTSSRCLTTHHGWSGSFDTEKRSDQRGAKYYDRRAGIGSSNRKVRRIRIENCWEFISKNLLEWLREFIICPTYSPPYLLLFNRWTKRKNRTLLDKAWVMLNAFGQTQ